MEQSNKQLVNKSIQEYLTNGVQTVFDHKSNDGKTKNLINIIADKLLNGESHKPHINFKPVIVAIFPEEKTITIHQMLLKALGYPGDLNVSESELKGSVQAYVNNSDFDLVIISAINLKDLVSIVNRELKRVDAIDTFIIDNLSVLIDPQLDKTFDRDTLATLFSNSEIFGFNLIVSVQSILKDEDNPLSNVNITPLIDTFQHSLYGSVNVDGDIEHQTRITYNVRVYPSEK